LKQKQNHNILLSRIDAIGDVVLSLPVAGILKNLYPECKIYFLGQTYTKEIIESSEHIDFFLDWDEIKKLHIHKQVSYFKSLNISIAIHIYPNFFISALMLLAGTPIRIGTSRRWYHLIFCNKKVSFSRWSSNLHETQLNLKLLIPFGLKKNLPFEKLSNLNGIKPPSLPKEIESQLDPNRFNIILHPKSKGHGKEWGVENYARLAGLLEPSKFKIFVTGTISEKKEIHQEILSKYSEVVDLVGNLTLNELIGFVSKADAIVASGTGPLHLAAATGIHAIGLYPPVRPVFSRRWAPVGFNAKAFEAKKICVKCKTTTKCECLRLLSPETIKKYLDKQTKIDFSQQPQVELISLIKTQAISDLEEIVKNTKSRTYASEFVSPNKHIGILISRNTSQFDSVIDKLSHFIDIKNNILIETSGICFFETPGDNKLQIIISKWSFLNPIKIYKLLQIFRRFHINKILVDNIDELKIAAICAKILGIKNFIYNQNETSPIKYTFINHYIFSKMVNEVIIQSERNKYPNLMINYKLFSKNKIRVIELNKHETHAMHSF
jgi:ADP-heptose:LPS heptosyltransferase